MIVILVIILGVISFTNMTTDLLPNMDFPYVVMYTSFPGASPEKIETMVTKPLESAVSTLSGIESVQSVSYENVSLIIIEFSYGVNMDSVLIELSSRVDLVKASLDSNVGTPVYMKINPDMLPVMVLSAGVRDMDEIAASDFVTENVVPAIERVNGVATVSTAGLLKEEIRVTLSSSKIDALNDRILGAVDSELLEVQKQLRDARKELEEKKKQFETESKSQLDELNSAESAVADGYAQINEGYAQLDATYASLTAQLNELKTKRAQLVDLIDGVNNMETLENMLRLAEAAVSEAEKALEFAKNEIQKAYKVQDNRIKVIPNGWDHFKNLQADDKIFEKFGQLKSKEFYFTLGSLSKRKNLKWIAEYAKKHEDETFAVSGKAISGLVPPELEALKNLKNVVLLGYVTDGEVKALMKKCKAFVFPSYYEGFGIPPLEALSCGTKVVVSNRASLPEIYKDSAVYIDADSTDCNLAKLLEKKVDSPQKILENYTYENAAKKLLEAIKSL